MMVIVVVIVLLVTSGGGFSSNGVRNGSVDSEMYTSIIFATISANAALIESSVPEIAIILSLVVGNSS